MIPLRFAVLLGLKIIAHAETSTGDVQFNPTLSDVRLSSKVPAGHNKPRPEKTDGPVVGPLFRMEESKACSIQNTFRNYPYPLEPGQTLLRVSRFPPRRVDAEYRDYAGLLSVNEKMRLAGRRLVDA